MAHPSIAGLAQVAITVRDLEASVAFYRDVLGLKFLFKAAPAMAFFQCGEVRLMLSAEPGTDAESHPILYYDVEDTQRALTAIRNHEGVKVRTEPHVVARLDTAEVWLAFVEDPDGHPVGILSERSIA
jgi:methylmalonyl-CoA/ethylmalonyl-CoA epimerase